MSCVVSFVNVLNDSRSVRPVIVFVYLLLSHPQNEKSIRSAESMIYYHKPFEVYKLNCVEGSIPKPRSGHRCVTDGCNLYLFGGFNPHVGIDDDEMKDDPYWKESRPLFKELWQLNLSSKTWFKMPIFGSIPLQLASHAALIYQNYLLVYGGTGIPFGSNSSNKLHACNLESLQWQYIPTKGSLPPALYGQGSNLYTIGGTTGFQYFSEVHKLNLKTLFWKHFKVDNAPGERYRHELAYYMNKIYILGGGTAEECFALDQLPVFDINLCSWTTVMSVPDSNSIEKFPSARRCHSIVQFGSGGYDGECIFSDIWKLNLDTLCWYKLPTSLPLPVYFHSATLTQSGQMYVFGGVNNIQFRTRTNHVYCVWLTIGSLKEICWEAILHSFPQLLRRSRQKLLEIGIPFLFLKRLGPDALCG